VIAAPVITGAAQRSDVRGAAPCALILILCARRCGELRAWFVVGALRDFLLRTV